MMTLRNNRSIDRPIFWPGPAFLLMMILVALLWVAGGASKASAMGQVVVRVTSTLLLIVAILWLPRPVLRSTRPVWLVLAAAAGLVIMQLIPLPPVIWEALPGRAVFAEAAVASGQSQPWRPLAIVPGGAVNALTSLIVPLAALVLSADLPLVDQQRVPGLLLTMISAAMIVGLLQFSGAAIDNPLVNITPATVNGLIANRNHFALLLAIGCLVAPAWAVVDQGRVRWRGPLAFGLIGLFVLAILATGSRAGIILGMLAIAIGLALARTGIKRAMRRFPRWVTWAMVGGATVLLAALVAASLLAGRAVSIERSMTLDTGADMRRRGLPTVLDMVREYFPAGSGFGGFDPVFRLHEPFSLLRPTFFNHAHNDFAELAVDGGLPAIALLTVALIWWGRASIAAWWSSADVDDSHGSVTRARLGSAIIFLVLVASTFDYPVRTPIVMALTAIAGVWLAERSRHAG